MRYSLRILTIVFSLNITACQKQDTPAPAATAAKPPVEKPAAKPAADTAAAPATAAVPAPAAAPAPVATEFDPASVPVTTATLPPFPFFKEPSGQRSIHWGTAAGKPHKPTSPGKCVTRNEM